jgi:hypothetical protein
MITRRELFGYIMRQEIARAVAAEKRTREALRNVLRDGAGPRLQALYIADAATELGAIQEALTVIRDIVVGNLPEISEEELAERLERLLQSERARKEKR